MATDSRTDLPLVVGPGAGLAAYLIGYLLTYAVVAPALRDSPLGRVVAALEGAPPTVDLVGWAFYNAHFVDVVFRAVPILGSRTLSVVGGDGFTPLLFLLAPALLALAGAALAVRDGATSQIRGAAVGAMTLPGYLLAAVAGAIRFEVDVLGVTGGPEMVTAVGLAGILYPIAFAGGGGAVASILVARE
ncbi:MAG: hypothetical protein ABEJ77_03520 [Halanaeroarchaeum sp.]